MPISPAADPVPAAEKNDVRVIGLVAVAHATSHFFHLILAPLFPWLKEAFPVSYADLGFLMTMFFVMSGVGQVLAGFVVDRIGAFRVLIFGMVCLALSALVLALASNYGMLLFGSILAGLGNSIFHPSDFTLLNQRVSPARISRAFSWHGLSGNLGWAAAPAFLVGVASLADWRTALFAASILPLAVLAMLLANRRVLAGSEEHGGPIPDNSRGQAEPNGTSAIGFLRLPAIWMSFGFFLISASALGGIQSFSATALRSLYDMPLAWATAAYSAFMLASAVGTYHGGSVAAKTTRHDWTIARAFLCTAALCLLIATGLPPAWLAIVLMAAVGFGAGLAGPSRDMMIRAASPRNATGRVYGLVYSGLDVGLALAPLLFGLVMDAGKPSWLFVGIGFFQAAAILTAFSVVGHAQRQAMPATAPAARS